MEGLRLEGRVISNEFDARDAFEPDYQVAGGGSEHEVVVADTREDTIKRPRGGFHFNRRPESREPAQFLDQRRVRRLRGSQNV